MSWNDPAEKIKTPRSGGPHESDDEAVRIDGGRLRANLVGRLRARADVILEYDTTSSAFSSPTITGLGSVNATLNSADSITFTSSSVPLVGSGSLTVTYTPESFGQQSVAQGDSTPLGTFTASTTGNFAAATLGATFDLAINQTLPEAGTGSTMGHLVGRWSSMARTSTSTSA